MSYKFIDINEVSGDTILPSEALMINGEFIENLISGYRTLSVEGREALSPELTTYETGVRDGSALKSRRYPARTITVKYQLITNSNEEFRSAYNQLAAILDVQNAELIFNDEQDKFFIGTPSAMGPVEPGRNAVIGEIDFFCADPFKYSVAEYEADPSTSDGSSILVDYGGTYKAFPTFEAKFDADCGFAAFFNENENIIQLGDPEEKDTETYPPSQQILIDYFNDEDPWNDEKEANWLLNSGHGLPANYAQVGSVGMMPGSYYAAVASNTSGTLLKRTSQNDTKDKPIMYYSLTAKTSERTEHTVKVTIAITAALEKNSNYFGRGFGLKGSVYIGGEWRDVTIKKTTDYWKGSSGHTVNLTVTLEDLEADDTKITGIKFKATRTDSVGGKTGVLDDTTCNELKISTYTPRTPETYYLGATSYGAGNGYHGPSITRTLPIDAAGDVGARKFSFSAYPNFAPDENAEGKNQIGEMRIVLSDNNGNEIVGIRLAKNTVGRDIYIHTYIKGVEKNVSKINASKVSYVSIIKTQKTVKVTVSGFGKEFNATSIATYSVNKVTISMAQYASKPALTYNGIYNVRLTKQNCDTWEDIPNKFANGDELEVDCGTGTIKLNRAATPELGALGNDWENFYLTPGLNQIGFAWSDWCLGKPTIRMRYREVFL